MTTWPQINLNVSDGYAGCFGCGQDNPIGLKLKFGKDGDGVRTTFTPDERYQGWAGYLHGGIVGCLLDEALSWAAHFEGLICITAKIECRLKKLAPIGQPLVITSRITRRTRKTVQTAAAVMLCDNTVVAEGTATHFVVNTNGGREATTDAQ